MEKNIFSLVCVNESYQVVSVDNFSTEEDAYKQMEREYENEVGEATDMGFDVENDLYKKHAYVTYGETSYYWQIVKPKKF